MVTEPARPAARRLRAPRPGVQPAHPLHARRLHARAGGQPPHPRVPRERLHLARRVLPRPDPAARRRAADHRRRVPPPLAADHAAGVPPRADRRGAGHDGRPRSTARWRRGGRAIASTSTAGRASWRCAWRCARCSAWIPTAIPPASSRRASSSAALAFYGREYWLQILRGPGTPWAALQRRAAPARRPHLRRDRAPPPDRRARRGPALAAARRRGRGRRPARRPARARRGDDPAVRRPRHDDRDRGLPVLRAGRAGADDRRRRWPDDPARLDMALDETLRLYPPAWVGPRRVVRTFTFHGAHGARRRARQLLLLRLAPPARRVGGPGGVPAGALRARAARGPAQGRLRAVRRRARASASACASARPRSRRSPRGSSPAGGSSSSRGSGWRSARRRRSGPKDGLLFRVRAC